MRTKSSAKSDAFAPFCNFLKKNSQKGLTNAEKYDITKSRVAQRALLNIRYPTGVAEKEGGI